LKALPTGEYRYNPDDLCTIGSFNRDIDKKAIRKFAYNSHSNLPIDFLNNDFFGTCSFFVVEDILEIFFYNEDTDKYDLTHYVCKSVDYLNNKIHFEELYSGDFSDYYTKGDIDTFIQDLQGQINTANENIETLQTNLNNAISQINQLQDDISAIDTKAQEAIDLANQTAEQVAGYEERIELLESGLSTHIENTGNPHNTNAEQVGTYSKSIIDNKDLATAQTCNDYTDTKTQTVQSNLDTEIQNRQTADSSIISTQTAQGTQITNIITKNTEQDTAITNLQNTKQDIVVGNDGVVVNGNILSFDYSTLLANNITGLANDVLPNIEVGYDYTTLSDQQTDDIKTKLGIENGIQQG
jgi:hypothetical protein